MTNSPIIIKTILTQEDLDTSNELLMFSSTPLDAFVKCDGLIVLAECLPTLMPFIHEPLLNVTDKDKTSPFDEQASKTSPYFVVVRRVLTLSNNL